MISIVFYEKIFVIYRISTLSVKLSILKTTHYQHTKYTITRDVLPIFRSHKHSKLKRAGKAELRKNYHVCVTTGHSYYFQNDVEVQAHWSTTELN